MVQISRYIIILLSICQLTIAQHYTISGFVEDSQTRERLIGAHVIDSLSQTGTITNDFGFFSLKSTNNQAAIYSSYMGGSSPKHYLMLTKDTFVFLSINTTNILDEIIVVSESYRQEVTTPLGLTTVSMKTINNFPALGETDVIKALQTDPGAKGGIEGASGLYVRGGGFGENLFLLDDVPVYNVSHLYGFFSAFNGSAIKDIKLYKSSFPSRYGGRASSVVAIRSREGTNERIKGEVSVGLVSSKLLLEGPLFNKKTTFLVSGRRSYLDLVVKPLKSNGLIDNSFPDYHFNDVNIGITHTFSHKNRIILNTYFGNDYIQEIVDKDEKYLDYIITAKDEETSGWGNLITSIRWNHAFKGRLFSNASLAYSKYNYSVENGSFYNKIDSAEHTLSNREIIGEYQSSIVDLIAKIDFDFQLNQSFLFRFGFGNTFRLFEPGNIKNTIQSTEEHLNTETTFSNQNPNVNEYFAYLEAAWNPGPKYNTNAGCRISGQQFGSAYSFNIEPRVAMSYSLTDYLAFKLGYARMFQYTHLVIATGLNKPMEIWLPAADNIKPLMSDQISFGTSFRVNKRWLLAVEAYNKWLSNTTAIKNGISLLTDFIPWQEILTQGNGEAKGLEIGLDKQSGKLTGKFTYSLSNSNRTFPLLNNGETFDFDYDRLHDISIYLNYKLSAKWDFSALWIYGTGFPVSLPVAQYISALDMYNLDSEVGGEVYYYPSLNNYRLPAYHRLDVGAHYKKTNKIGKHIISIDIFNVYNRKNPVTAYYRGYNNKKLKYGYLLPIIPSFSYTMEF